MKIGHRHGERHRNEGCVLFIPINWTHFAVAQWKKNNKNNGKWHGSGKLLRFLRNGFIHCYRFETYKWGFSQYKFTSKDSFVVVATIYMEFMSVFY